MPPTSDVPALPAGWSRREAALLVGLTAALLALLVLRVQTRRIDSARLPARPDVIVLHVDELRSDAAPAAALAADLGLDVADVLVFSQAFAQSSDGRRSALSALRGDLALNLDGAPGPDSLPAAIGREGWRTVLFGPPSLAAAAGSAFAATSSVEPSELAAALASVVSADEAPVFAFVHVPPAGPPLHGQTTDAAALHAAYRERVASARTLLGQLAVSSDRDRPQLIVLLGGSGAELGEHPEDPEHLHDTRLRVPFLIGLRHATGLPHGQFSSLVQSADLAPTLLDFVDLRASAERARDGIDRDGVSLEPLVHGWTVPPVHERLYFAGPSEAAVRTTAWKLSGPVDEPWTLRPFGVRLHALEEDPGERHDLAAGREMGPVGSALLAALRGRLERADAAGGR